MQKTNLLLMNSVNTIPLKTTLLPVKKPLMDWTAEIAASTTDFTKLNHLMAEKENAELKLEHLMDRYVYLTDLLESFKK